jgi:dTDP-4-dehydrorhamnose reductase
MRVTLFGSTGLMGKALIQRWTGDSITGLNSKDADLRDPQQVLAAVQRTHPDWIILAAAYTNVDGCETNSQLAFDVNCQGAVNVAEAAQRVGARLLFLSSDYVFDGTKSKPYEVTDPRGPRSVYGRSKAEAEVKLQQVLPECCIVRTSWLFGVGGNCFPDTILKLAASRPTLDVVDDQRGSPTYTPDLARAIYYLCNAGAAGIVHATNRGDSSWFEFARQIVQRAGLTSDVRPTTTDKFPRPAERPKYSVLSPASLDRFQIKMPAWQDALDRYLLERTAIEKGSR